MDTHSTQMRACPPAQGRLRKAAWPALVLTLTLAACGGGGKDADSTDTGGTPDVLGTCGLATPSEFQKDLLARINALRAAGADCGSGGVFAATDPVTWNDLLAQASDDHATDMSAKNYFSHTSADGRTLGDRVTAVGYPWSALGENIAAGQDTAESVMAAWKGSPGHCANIMSPSFKEVGVACELAAATTNTYKTYWVMDLGTRK
ncbi:CAP domain-containing protein [Roseateles sp. YR242]|uniref:CAP domain-containing protein n=1 Tax=Roseateles sp. YR242 TaxID=1855305 RepID=UPI0021010534|nr:CAP domain-containing protein [Roseateles sp. YR242]